MDFSVQASPIGVGQLVGGCEQSSAESRLRLPNRFVRAS